MTHSLRKLLVLLLCAGMSVGMIAAAHAAYPDRPVRLIVGFPPGGGVDTIARLIGQKLEEKWGHRVVVENRAGADATVGNAYVAASPPDGYVIAIVVPNHTIAASVYKDLSYDTVKSFAPVVLIGAQPNVLVVNPAFPANTLPELVALAKAKPGQYNYASSGSIDMPYLEMEMLKKLTGIDVVNVRYRGSAPMMLGLLAGDVQMMIVAPTIAVEQVKAGKLKALAVTAKSRTPALPDTPTIVEAANLTNFDSSGNWYGILAPAGTPKDIIAKLNADIIDVVKSADLQQALISRGVTTIASTPEEFGDFIVKDIAKWAPMLKDFAPK